MLTESFITAVLPPSRSKPNSVAKDVGIHLQDFQPVPALKTSFKKSSTPPNCLAVSASHIFAAQAEKAVVHVYSREKGNQEATVPFPERIHSVALAGDTNGAGVLVLGTEEGRVILWEVNTQPFLYKNKSRISTDVACSCVLAGKHQLFNPTFNRLLP